MNISVIEKDFVCNLGACKGECCISGAAGAPVTKDEVTILKDNKSVEIIEAGEYFGEDSLLSKLPKVSKATVSSDWCRIIAANELHIKKILTEDPEVAMRFLNHLAKTVRSL